ncbi:transcriptional regulator, XRE family protein [Kitasatospora sp. NPDC056783]|uniref:transcriptional regulator, XRE family protein n=1 Tax=Kitasatospora sp. NPDC056783 TaxID=3345943 RepID=UPI0036A134B4
MSTAAVVEPQNPTLLWRRLQPLRATSWSAFQIHFAQAARRAAHETKNPRLATLAVSNNSFRRWIAGEQMPRADARAVLEHWFGQSVEVLLGPAMGLPAARTLPDDTLTLARTVSRQWATSTLTPTESVPGTGGHWRLDGVATFDPTDVTVQLYEARRRGEMLIIDPADHEHLRHLAAGSGRALVIAAHEGELHLLDAAHARRHLASPHPLPLVPVHRSHRLDDLTYALTWALLLCDDALLADDHALEDQQEALEQYRQLPRSAPARASMPDLRAATSAFLGSEFCARHILGLLEDAGTVPLFWTREQRGEQAVGWLLFRHKHAYLRAAGARFGVRGSRRMARAFCIPADTVAGSDPYERILLFLAVALMELHGLDVWVSADEAYAGVEGFVLVPGERAIVANWVAGNAMWRVDATDAPGDLLGYEQLLDDASAASIMRGDNPGDRLRALSEHLALDWAWLTGRCGELAATGASTMLRPRSRHLTLTEVDRVLAFVASLERR